MKRDDDFVGRDRDIGRHGEKVPKDVTGLSIRVAANTAGEPAIQSAGDDEEGQIKVDLEGDGGRKGVHMEEADGIADSVFDEHTPCVSSEELDMGSRIVGEKDGGLLMAQVKNIDLAHGSSLDPDLLFEDPWGLEGSSGDIQLQSTPSRGRERIDFLEDTGGATS